MAKEKPQEIKQPNPEVEQETVPEFEQITEHPDHTDVRLESQNAKDGTETFFDQY